jgi:hypothetical protein
MNRTQRMGRLGGLVAVAAALAPFAWLWVLQMNNARNPLTFRARLDMAIWMAVLGTPWMLAAWLLWRAWWRQAGARLAVLDGPGWLLAAAAATLPDGRREWGAAMTAELAQVQGRPARCGSRPAAPAQWSSRHVAAGRRWGSPGHWRSRRRPRPRWRPALPCPRAGCSR